MPCLLAAPQPANILVDARTGRVKLSDFGLARRYVAGQAMPYTERVVTLCYRAPELLLASRYGSAVDVWSVGCILAELLNADVLFKGSAEVGWGAVGRGGAMWGAARPRTRATTGRPRRLCRGWHA